MNLGLCRTVPAALLVAALWIGSLARADSVWQGALEIKDVKITKVTEGKLFYMVGGRETSRDLKSVTRLQIDDEPALNEAEKAYADEKWDAAAEAFRKVTRSTNKPWLKQWASARLLDAASHSNNFAAAVAAYIALVQQDVTTAATKRPNLPPDKASTFLDTAVKDLETAAGSSTLQPPQKMALYSLERDILRQQGKNKEALAVVEKMGRLPGADASVTADATLGTAMIALEEKDYKKAGDLIEGSRALFSDPRQQAEALFVLAESQYALAMPTKDKTKLQDAAMNFMRLVAHFKDLEGRPHIAEALLRTAQIEEAIGNPAEALRIYKDIANGEFKDSPQAKPARERVEALSAAAAGGK